MYFERIKQEGLAQNSYIIGSENACAVIDPRRDCSIYRVRAAERNMRIKYIFETHRNEDFVIGSSELAALSGAAVFHGFRPDWRYGNTVKDGDVFKCGKISIRAIMTAGHTDESFSYVVVDDSFGEPPIMVFTGDTLFIGSTGRVDLNGEAEIPRMAANLYDSIFKRLLPLGDEVIICPAHSAGSVCGTHIADREESTIGIERKQNPAFKVQSRDEFLSLKSAEKPELPPYFKTMEAQNLQVSRDPVTMVSPPSLSPHEFQAAMEKGMMIVDTSQPAAFGGAHIKGAYSIWLEGLASFSGLMLPYDTPILLALEKKDELGAAIRSLFRLGYDNIAGYLDGGVEGWYNSGKPFEQFPLLSVFELKKMLDGKEKITVLDVRRLWEFRKEHIDGAQNIYVGDLQNRTGEVSKEKPVAVICSVGRRASIGSSLLLRAGFPRVYNVLGGMDAWVSAGFPVTS